MMGSLVDDIFRKIISNIEYRSIEATQTEMQGEKYNKNNNNKQSKTEHLRTVKQYKKCK